MFCWDGMWRAVVLSFMATGLITASNLPKAPEQVTPVESHIAASPAQIILSSVVGAAVGVLVGASSSTFSGDADTGIDMLPYLTAGAAGAAVAIAPLNLESLIALAMERDHLDPSSPIFAVSVGFRKKLGEERAVAGLIGGVVAGSFTRIVTAPSTAGGSSESMTSSSSSFGTDAQPTSTSPQQQQQKKLSVAIFDFPLLHVGLSGGIAAFITAYFAPELIRCGDALATSGIGNTLVSASGDLAGLAKLRAKDMHNFLRLPDLSLAANEKRTIAFRIKMLHRLRQHLEKEIEALEAQKKLELEAKAKAADGKV